MGSEWYHHGVDQLHVAMPASAVGAVRFMEVQMLMTRLPGKLPVRTPIPMGWQVSSEPKPDTLTRSMPGSVIFRQAVTNADDSVGVLIEAPGADIHVATWVQDPLRVPSPAEWASARAELLGIAGRL